MSLMQNLEVPKRKGKRLMTALIPAVTRKHITTGK
ncbi:hypothetical protein M8C21_033096 [Ambrosia artemisiifolia]|uniref:Uncharacterized protein n=1 Tax=Ambrosia artemisiifolia TaxID=4212 RepID=A0AAD5CQ24_AMBAR|nr:hypothetical protein M8C21_033096 [Ambrosia artemisiifolia]